MCFGAPAGDHHGVVQVKGFVAQSIELDGGNVAEHEKEKGFASSLLHLFPRLIKFTRQRGL